MSPLPDVSITSHSIFSDKNNSFCIGIAIILFNFIVKYLQIISRKLVKLDLDKDLWQTRIQHQRVYKYGKLTWITPIHFWGDFWLNTISLCTPVATDHVQSTLFHFPASITAIKIDNTSRNLFVIRHILTISVDIWYVMIEYRQNWELGRISLTLGFRKEYIKFSAKQEVHWPE